MKGGVTYQDMERRKQLEKNVNAALEYLRGINKCEACLQVEVILQRQRCPLSATLSTATACNAVQRDVR